MNEIVQSAWWSIEVPKGSEVDFEPECVTITSSAFEGVLQISSVRKGTGPIDDSDLLEFATDDGASDPGSLESVTLPRFQGLTLATHYEGLFMRKWWLANDSLLVFATYTSPSALSSSDLDQVHALLSTLSPTPAEL